MGNIEQTRGHMDTVGDRLSGDIESARKLAVKLKEDKDFYKECSQIAMRKYKECFDEEVYIYTMKKVIEEVISTWLKTNAY